MRVTYDFTKEEAKAARGANGITVVDEIRWRVKSHGNTDWNVAKTEVSFNATRSTTNQYAPSNWATTNAAWHDASSKLAEHYAWVNKPNAPINYWSDDIDLTSAAAVTGGRDRAKLGTSRGVTEIVLASIPTPALPTLAVGQAYRIFTFDSTDGDDFTFSAANASGYGLFTASSADLVEDMTSADGDSVLDPSATLSPVYPNGSPFAGIYSGTNNNLVLRSDTEGKPLYLSAYTYSATPTALVTLTDGQSVLDSAELASGNTALWLFFETEGDTVGFVITVVDLTNPTLSISDASVTEGNSGTTNANFTVSLSAASAQTITVDYSTSSFTASSSSDFAATSGTLTFNPYETNKAFNVPVNGDTVYELNENFFVNLGSATAASILDGVGQGTIVNDDAVPSIVIGDVTSLETNSGTTSFNFPVTLSHASQPAVTVNYATTAGTAGSPSDYTALNGTLTFASGQTSMLISALVNGDTTQEAHETFSLSLSSPVNATLSDFTGLGTIENDDQQPTITIMASPALFVQEGNSGTTIFSFAVTLSNPSSLSVSMDFASSDGGDLYAASAGSDYEATSGTLTFAPLETSKTITVTIYGDTTFEEMESFTMNLSNAVNATFFNTFAVGYINDDD